MGDTALGIKRMHLGLASMPVTARIVEVDALGRASVTFPGCETPVPARCAAAPTAVPPRDQIVGVEVLIVFEDADARRPLIVGFVRDALWPTETCVPSKVLVEATDEVVIRCGKGSLSMTADGRVVLKGTRVTSRATEANKLRGAVVLIN
jgi:hypothetical protein